MARRPGCLGHAVSPRRLTACCAPAAAPPPRSACTAWCSTARSWRGAACRPSWRRCRACATWSCAHAGWRCAARGGASQPRLRAVQHRWRGWRSRPVGAAGGCSCSGALGLCLLLRRRPSAGPPPHVCLPPAGAALVRGAAAGPDPAGCGRELPGQPARGAIPCLPALLGGAQQPPACAATGAGGGDAAGAVGCGGERRVSPRAGPRAVGCAVKASWEDESQLGRWAPGRQGGQAGGGQHREAHTRLMFGVLRARDRLRRAPPPLRRGVPALCLPAGSCSTPRTSPPSWGACPRCAAWSWPARPPALASAPTSGGGPSLP